ncbi:MAG: methionine synthase, partial [Propionibacteriaceae bacterium]|nr:methionine synthase [Propionibacteriaceae bacterium]
ADYFRDESEARSNGVDVLGLQLVTVGEKIGRRADQLFKDGSFRDYFELHGLSVQLTEAFAEMWHDHIRTEMGLTPLTDDKAEMIAHQRYQGARYSLGYPACPDLWQRTMIMGLLKPETIGVTMSEEYQLHPEQSTDALIVHHPQARYFSVR